MLFYSRFKKEEETNLEEKNDEWEEGEENDDEKININTDSDEEEESI